MRVSHSRPLRWLFDLYLGHVFRRDFVGVHLEIPDSLTTGAPLTLPTLLVANHCSWWDGFFLAWLQRHLFPQASFFTVMLESELRKFPFFRRLGAVGIDPANPVSVARVFHQLKVLTQERSGPIVIAYFPQGEIRPQFESDLNFKPGIELLVKMLRPVQIIPVALGIEPLRARKPFGYVLAGEPLLIDAESNVLASSLEDRVAQLLRHQRPRSVSRHMNASAAP